MYEGNEMKDIGLALFVYRRPGHTRQTLESVKKNGFEKIYIFQDGLADDRDRKEWEEVSQIIKTADFKEKELHISEKNQGLAESIIKGAAYVFSKHECAVILEDDICLGRGYFDYMAACFAQYRDNKDISAAAGWGWPIQIPADYQYDIYFSYRFSCYAWGTWRDRWDKYTRDYTLFAKILKDKEKKKILDMAGSDLYATMQAQVLGRCDSWAHFWSLMQIYNQQLCVLPVKYLAQNIGHDGLNGTNCDFKTTRFDTQLHDYNGEKIRFPERIIINDDIVNQIRVILNHPLPEERIGSYNSMLKKWLMCLQAGCSFERYFEKHKMHSVYIYGAGDIAWLLIRQIQKIIDIKGILVHDKAEKEFCGYPVYDFSDKAEIGYENIIVIPVHDMEYIEYSINKNYGSQNLIPLHTMLDQLLTGCKEKEIK